VRLPDHAADPHRRSGGRHRDGPRGGL